MRLLLLCQGKSWEFLDLAYLTHFPDSSLIIFFSTGLNEPLKSQLISDGPRWTFCEFVELAVQFSGSSFTVGEVEEDYNMAAPESLKHFFVGSYAPQAPVNADPQLGIISTFKPGILSALKPGILSTQWRPLQKII